MRITKSGLQEMIRVAVARELGITKTSSGNRVNGYIIEPGANLRYADLSGADLQGVDLTMANLSRANLSRTDLTGAKLEGANLTKALLNRTNLTRVNLKRANLTNIYFDHVIMSRADLRGANLTGVEFYATKLINVKFDIGANIFSQSAPNQITLDDFSPQIIKLINSFKNYSRQDMQKALVKTPYPEMLARFDVTAEEWKLAITTAIAIKEQEI